MMSCDVWLSTLVTNHDVVMFAGKCKLSEHNISISDVFQSEVGHEPLSTSAVT